MGKDQHYHFSSCFIYGSFRLKCSCSGSGCAARMGRRNSQHVWAFFRKNNERPILPVPQKLLFRIQPQRRRFSHFGTGHWSRASCQCWRCPCQRCLCRGNPSCRCAHSGGSKEPAPDPGSSRDVSPSALSTSQHLGEIY